MSVIGPGSIGALNLAGSLAGAQRNNAGENEVKAGSSERKFQQDQNSLAATSLGDVAETDRSADRDADGRMPYHSPPSPDAQADSDQQRDEQPPHPSDAFGERGNRLDLEA